MREEIFPCETEISQFLKSSFEEILQTAKVEVDRSQISLSTWSEPVANLTGYSAYVSYWKHYFNGLIPVTVLIFELHMIWLVDPVRTVWEDLVKEFKLSGRECFVTWLDENIVKGNKPNALALLWTPSKLYDNVHDVFLA